MSLIDDIKRDREADGDWRQGTGDDQDLIFDGYGRRIASAWAVECLNRSKQRANARRIARVPQMEAALLAAEELAARAGAAFANEYDLTRHIDGATELYQSRMKVLAAFHKALEAGE